MSCDLKASLLLVGNGNCDIKTVRRQAVLKAIGPFQEAKAGSFKIFFWPEFEIFILVRKAI